MKSQLVNWMVACVLLVLVGFATGCGKSGPKYAKVDITQKIQDLKSSDTDKQEDAAIALATAGPNAAPAVPALIEALKSHDALLRRLAAYALMNIGPKASAAVPALKAALKDSDVSVVQQAMNSLRAIDPKQFQGLQMENVTQ